MPRTYELYLRHADGHVRFEALTYRGSHFQLMSHVQGLLKERQADAIEVRTGGEHLFTLAAPEG